MHVEVMILNRGELNRVWINNYLNRGGAEVEIIIYLNEVEFTEVSIGLIPRVSGV